MGTIETIRDTLVPYYIYIKYVHLLLVMAWSWSTSHAFMFYLVPVFQEWRKNPNDINRIKMRDWVMERFDDGVILEHIAFPLVIFTGLTMYIVGGWSLSAGWLALKLSIVVAIMIPIEICDYYLSHFGGNKFGLRMKGQTERYEKMMHAHWLFLLVATPLIILFMPAIIFLVLVKPF